MQTLTYQDKYFADSNHICSEYSHQDRTVDEAQYYLNVYMHIGLDLERNYIILGIQVKFFPSDQFSQSVKWAQFCGLMRKSSNTWVKS